MLFVKKVGIYSIYELDRKECREHWGVFPTFVCWYSHHHEEIGNMSTTENESETLLEMVSWCKQYS